MSWIDFWNRETSIYVSERHKALHYRGVAKDIAGLIEGTGRRVLDHGSGEATSADIVAEKCAVLFLCDAAPNTRARIAARFAGDARIRPIAPEDVALIEDESLDLIVANSLLQYLDEATLEGLLEVWTRKLKPSGRLVLADVVPPGVSPLTDALALLRFGRDGGFLAAAAGGLVRTFFSDYRKLRGELGLATHAEADILARLARHGLAGRRLAKNIGHNPARMSFEATKA